MQFLLDCFREFSSKPALIWNGLQVTYDELLQNMDGARTLLRTQQVRAGSVVAIESDFSPRSVATLLALIENNCVVIPLSATVSDKKAEFLATAEAQCCLTITQDKETQVEHFDRVVQHPILLQLLRAGHPGLVLFSSGTTGKSKAAVHDFLPLLEKFKVRRHSKRMLSFLLFDHIGGINTLFYCLSNGGTLVTVAARTPDCVARAIQNSKVQILPTSPTFLNLLLMSPAHQQYDLSSLELITYGTEPMPETTLSRLHQAFPNVQLQQTYGLSELGILRSKSKSSDSLWIKIGGEGFQTRVVDGLLEIKAQSAMLGYLNAPSPFTPDGWFQTGDMVEIDGEYLKIRGRKSDLINVGGEKVYPAEVESLLMQLPGVKEAVVNSEAHPLVGKIVVAAVQLDTSESVSEFRVRMRKALQEQGVASFKIPQKVTLSADTLHSTRFKKLRTLS